MGKRSAVVAVISGGHDRLASCTARESGGQDTTDTAVDDESTTDEPQSPQSPVVVAIDALRAAAGDVRRLSHSSDEMNDSLDVLRTSVNERASKLRMSSNLKTIHCDVMADNVAWRTGSVEVERRGLGLKLFGLFMAGFVATFCVAFPFGEAFKKDGDNSIAANWSYYFIYNVFGWGGLWIKILLVQCWLWEQPFFLPFMKGQARLFEFNKCFAAFFVSEAFSTLFFLLGYWIWQDPVPFGTMSFGSVCCAVHFVCIYIFIIPADSRKTREDHFVWAPFVLWLGALLVYSFLLWLCIEVITKWRDDSWTGELWYNVGMTSIHVVFLLIRGSFCTELQQALLGKISMEIGTVWRFTYKCQMTNFTMWMFPILGPGMWVTPLLSAVMGCALLGGQMLRIQHGAYNVADELIKIAFCIFSDICTALNFLVIMNFNFYGPNKRHMYIIDKLSEEQCMHGTLTIICLILGKVIEAVAFVLLARRRFEPEVLQQVRNFFAMTMNKWHGGG
eukprot:TRINITY_DN18484_c0_g1_i3.p1 TRINITY_DN18484_c0_g1~~TRINITY_DN18484_c0_g1_i3.p1  ORF type:complete len:544 (-),score=68.18 TRINITY_DN18484_c0_g1_i3:261-1772(-)